jgi:hypothetical protein
MTQGNLNLEIQPLKNTNNVDPSNYTTKVNMIKNILEDVKWRKGQHYSAFGKYKRSNMFVKSFINILNAVSVSSMVLTFTPVSPVVMIVAITASSMSGISSALSSAVDLDGKIHSHNTSYLQYVDLYRDISARLLRNGLSSSDLDGLLNEVNDRMGLIEDHSSPIKSKV